MKEIFEHIKDRSWDWFREASNEVCQKWLKEDDVITVGDWGVCFYSSGDNTYSLADLLANKSWCKAVWGKEMTSPPLVRGEVYATFPLWEHHSAQAFQILQQQGEQAAIKYILQTVI